MQQQSDPPLDAQTLDRSADSPQASREIYVVSAVMIDDQNPMERAWLYQLAAALKLDPTMARELDQQIQKVAGCQPKDTQAETPILAPLPAAAESDFFD